MQKQKRQAKLQQAERKKNRILHKILWHYSICQVNIGVGGGEIPRW